MKPQKSEGGQVLILLVLGVVVLLGFTALALDGGMLYSDRRHAQSASDSASLAGGGSAALYLEDHGILFANFSCSNSQVIAAQAAAKTAAIGRANDNGYTIDEDISDAHGVTTVCNVAGNDRYIDIRVLIARETSTSFAHLVYDGVLQSNVEAITRIRPRSPLALGHAIVALNPAACQGQQNGAGFHGNAGVDVTGGGIFSNGCLQADGGPDIDVVGGAINYVVEVDNEDQFNPAPQPASPLPDTTLTMPEPDCGHDDAWNGTGNQLLAASPLDPGLYCVSGDLRINASDTLAGNGITIVLSNGELRINGGGTVQITAPVADPDPSPAIAGLLIYAPSTNHNEIQINGNADSYFQGTVFAPGADINMLGNGQTDAFNTQLIGWNVEVGGTADTYVVFDQLEQYNRPANLELYK